mmetsp:Transcript_32834/g.94116  ORF Transcript_32834/g.94116 Transcript_32834/m.94116 type:complete len:271 (-) Transcript_32834:641-1453(-)
MGPSSTSRSSHSRLPVCCTAHSATCRLTLATVPGPSGDAGASTASTCSASVRRVRACARSARQRPSRGSWPWAAPRSTCARSSGAPAYAVLRASRRWRPRRCSAAGGLWRASLSAPRSCRGGKGNLGRHCMSSCRGRLLAPRRWLPSCQRMLTPTRRGRMPWAERGLQPPCRSPCSTACWLPGRACPSSTGTHAGRSGCGCTSGRQPASVRGAASAPSASRPCPRACRPRSRQTYRGPPQAWFPRRSTGLFAVCLWLLLQLSQLSAMPKA